MKNLYYKFVLGEEDATKFVWQKKTTEKVEKSTSEEVPKEKPLNPKEETKGNSKEETKGNLKEETKEETKGNLSKLEGLVKYESSGITPTGKMVKGSAAYGVLKYPLGKKTKLVVVGKQHEKSKSHRVITGIEHKKSIGEKAKLESFFGVNVPLKKTNLTAAQIHQTFKRGIWSVDGTAFIIPSKDGNSAFSIGAGIEFDAFNKFLKVTARMKRIYIPAEETGENIAILKLSTKKLGNFILFAEGQYQKPDFSNKGKVAEGQYQKPDAVKPDKGKVIVSAGVKVPLHFKK